VDAEPQQQWAPGPLLLFPDTSAMLAMLGAGEGLAQKTGFTMSLLKVGGWVWGVCVWGGGVRSGRPGVRASGWGSSHRFGCGLCGR
jgi:hypothetical protein